MPTAEELAKDPDFIKLHAADPRAAEQLMTEQLQVGTESSPNIIGRLKSGRSIVRNPDGSVSTHRNMIVNLNGQEHIIPTIYGGRQVSEDEAIDIIKRNKGIDPDTGKPVPRYNTVQEAEQAEQQMHGDLEKETAPYIAGASQPQQGQGIVGKVGSFVGNAFKRGGQEFLEATPTAAKIASFVVPAGIAGRVAAQGGGQLAQLLGAGAGNELVTMGSRLLQPGSASMEQRLTPGVEDAVSLAAPFAAQAVTHPIETGKGLAGAFAKSSKVGQQAVQNVEKSAAQEQIDAAQKQLASVKAANADIKATAGHSKALQDKYMAQSKAEYEAQSSQYEALKKAQIEAKKKAAEEARQLGRLQKEENVSTMATWVKNRKGVPTEDDVRAAYTATDTLAQGNTEAVKLPNVQATRKTLLKEAEAAAKTPGADDVAGILKGMAESGTTEGLTLSNIQDSLKILNRRIAAYGRSTDLYASERRDALMRIRDAMEKDLEGMANSSATPAAFRDSLKAANELYLKQRTHEEMGTFLTHDMIRPNAAGNPSFSPQTAIAALDSKQNAKMVGYMKKVIDPESGKSLYETTKTTLETLAGDQFKQLEAARLLKQTGGIPLPEKPVSPNDPSRLQDSGIPKGLPLQPEPSIPEMPKFVAPRTGGIAVFGRAAATAAGAGIGYNIGGPWGAVAGGSTGFGLPRVLSEIMMTKGGQDLLVSLVKHQGREISPAMMGMLGAAIKAMGEGQ